MYAGAVTACTVPWAITACAVAASDMANPSKVHFALVIQIIDHCAYEVGGSAQEVAHQMQSVWHWHWHSSAECS
jgi:hypothetical protein